MRIRARLFTPLICLLTLFSIETSAQSIRRTGAQAEEQTAAPSQNTGSMEAVAGEIALLRKSVQTLTARLSEITERVLSSDSSRNDPQNRISLALDLLTRAEQRAETLRKQLLELIEKETAFRSRLVQIDEESRPESIERSMSLQGSTRTPEIRDTRRRVLDNERRGVESLLRQTSQSRQQLEEDVKQADSLVGRLRQRVLPMVEREVEKINPN